MRISDEERREAAARLRGERKGSLPEFITKAAFGVDYAKGTDMLTLPKRLADLIDRPTCRNLSPKPADVFLCSECGEHVDIAYVDTCDDYHAKHCPDCGAEVVE